MVINVINSKTTYSPKSLPVLSMCKYWRILESSCCLSVADPSSAQQAVAYILYLTVYKMLLLQLWKDSQIEHIIWHYVIA